MNTRRLSASGVKKSLAGLMLALTTALFTIPQLTLAQDSPVITPDNAAALTTIEHWGRGTMRDVAWSADGQRMAVLTSAGVWIQDAGDERPQLFPTTSYKFYSVDISPDGRWVVAGSWDDGAHLWDTTSGNHIKLPDPQTGEAYAHWILSVAFGPDGRSIAAGNYGGWAHLWSIDENGQAGAPTSIELGSGDIQDIRFSPDGHLIASAVRQSSTAPVLWDIRNNRTRTVGGPNRDVTSVAFSPDGSQIASGSFTGEVYVWDTATGMLKATLTGLHSFVTNVSFNGDGTALAAIDIGGVAQAWSLEGGEPVAWPLVGETVPQALAVTPDAANGAAFRVALSQLDELRRWTVMPENTEIPSPQIYDGYNWTPWSLAIHPDGTHFAVGIHDTTGHIGAPVVDRIRLWQTGQAEPLAELEGHEWIVTNLSFNHDGTLIHSGGQDNTARLWSFPDGELTLTMNASEQTLLSSALSPDDRWIATASFDETVVLWDAASGDRVATLPAPRVQAVGFSAGSQRLIALSDQGDLWQWEIEGITNTAPATTVSLAERDWSHGLVNAVAFRPEAEQMAVAFSDGNIEVWDVNSGERLAALTPDTENGFANGAEAVAWSPDGALLASGDTGGELRLWDVAAGREIVVLREHTDWITSVAFTPDGRELFTASWDGLIRRWAVAS